MIFNKHFELKGKHALLAPSQPYWLRYSEDQLFQKFQSTYAQEIGTSLHELAETLISERIKLKKTDKTLILVHLLHAGIPRPAIDIDRLYQNFMVYVNDAIGFRLTPEQILVYSEDCYGTADTISFNDNFLRIHDYKSGSTPAKMEQLLIYAGLFCLEYNIRPGELAGCELRIYQNDDIEFGNPTADDIAKVMDTIRNSATIVHDIKMGG